MADEAAHCRQFGLHLRVDVIQGGLGHEALAHTLLAGGQDRGATKSFAKLQRLDDSGAEMKIVPAQHVTGTGGEIDDTVAVKKNSRAAHA